MSAAFFSFFRWLHYVVNAVGFTLVGAFGMVHADSTDERLMAAFFIVVGAVIAALMVWMYRRSRVEGAVQRALRPTAATDCE